MTMTSTYDNAESVALTTIDQLPAPLTDPMKQLVADFFGAHKDATLRTYRQALNDFSHLPTHPRHIEETLPHTPIKTRSNTGPDAAWLVSFSGRLAVSGGNFQAALDLRNICADPDQVGGVIHVNVFDQFVTQPDISAFGEPSSD